MRYWAEKEGKRSAVIRNVSKTTQSLLIDRLKPFTVYVINVTALKNGEKINGQTKISTDEGGMLYRQIRNSFDSIHYQ